MTIGARLNSRITHMAVGRHLPYRAVRVRLTLLYGGLFLLSGAALMAIAYALLVNAGFVFSLQNGNTTLLAGPPPGSVRRAPLIAVATPGSATHPSAQTMAHWRGVAQCMRQHGVAGFPEPRSSVPLHPVEFSQIDDRDGAILAIPATLDTQSRTFVHATNACGFMPDVTKAAATADRRRTQVRQELVIQSGIALAGMSLLSLFLGWLMAGRVLQPLEDAYEAQRRFVANASHELRAPLTRQRALIEVSLADPDADVAALRGAQERVLASEQHLEQLIDALLALTRGQAGLKRRERFDLASLATQALQPRDSEIASLGLDVRATLDSAPTAGDPRLLERLITNLIDNAIRHNTHGGHVAISTGIRDRRAFVSIENSGPTVPPEQIHRLFEPFERLGDARTGHDSGHGLGLSIVQAIADAHGAELSVRPGPEGGLAIEVAFPSTIGAASGIRFAPAWAKRASPRTSLQD
jgi:signal transduction histidine kinase